MDDRRVAGFLRRVQRTDERPFRIVPPGEEDRALSLERAGEVRRERFARGIHVPESGIAAGRRDFDRIQHRSDRSARAVGEIGMPHRATVGNADIAAALAACRDEKDLRMVLQHRVVGGMLVQAAETPREIHMLLWRNPLVAEHQHQMVEMRALHLLEGFIVERFRQVEAYDLGAERIR